MECVKYIFYLLTCDAFWPGCFKRRFSLIGDIVWWSLSACLLCHAHNKYSTFFLFLCHLFFVCLSPSLWSHLLTSLRLPSPLLASIRLSLERKFSPALHTVNVTLIPLVKMNRTILVFHPFPPISRPIFLLLLPLLVLPVLLIKLHHDAPVEREPCSKSSPRGCYLSLKSPHSNRFNQRRCSFVFSPN